MKNPPYIHVTTGMSLITVFLKNIVITAYRYLPPRLARLCLLLFHHGLLLHHSLLFHHGLLLHHGHLLHHALRHPTTRSKEAPHAIIQLSHNALLCAAGERSILGSRRLRGLRGLRRLRRGLSRWGRSRGRSRHSTLIPQNIRSKPGMV